MPTAQYSSFDRGFDIGHVEVESAMEPLIERRISRKAPVKESTKKILAMCLVGIMVISAITIFVPLAPKHDSPTLQPPAGGDNPRNQIGGSPEITWTISNFFEYYLKSTSMTGDYRTLGHDNTTMGWNQWWSERPLHAYDDTMLRSGYPFTLMYSYYSANLPKTGIQKLTDPRMAFGVYSFYRMTIDAMNQSKVATGAGSDPNFVPMLNPSGLGMDGGWVNWTWYLNYLTADETTAITAGSHYANSYYGVPAGAITWGGSNYNDGWWAELSGRMDFNVNAAKKFMNLPGNTGDLRTEFTAANGVNNALGTAFASHWTVDGTRAGVFNTYCTYDYEINSGQVLCYLTLDPDSTQTKLVVRIWGIAWGYEILMERFLEQAGIAKYQQTYPEDFYLNGTASPTNGDIHVRQVCVYKMLAWKDSGTWAPAWNIDTSHTDGCKNTVGSNQPGPASSWPSRYELYGATNLPAYHPNKMEWGPGTVNWGTRVMYWQPYLGFNLSAGQKLVVKLGNTPTMGYEPYKGASDTYIQDAAKIAELASHQVWGELVLGHGYPLTGANRLNQSQFYNHATKTLTLAGPLNLNTIPNPNPTFGRLNETGCPNLMFGVSRVSTYDVAIMGATPPFTSGTTYSLQVTARNYSGQAISNGTVQLACNNPGTTFGGGVSSHTFIPAENGVWTTTVVFGTAKTNTYINATSSLFPLDVNGAGGAWQVNAGIPEFAALMMPVLIIGIAVAVVVGRRGKSEE